MAQFLFATVRSSTGNLRTGTLSLDAEDGATAVTHISTPPGGDGDNFVYLAITFDEDLTDAAVVVSTDTLTQPGGVASFVDEQDLIVGLSVAYPVLRVLARL